jgi:hypothetical protein
MINVRGRKHTEIPERPINPLGRNLNNGYFGSENQSPLIHECTLSGSIFHNDNPKNENLCVEPDYSVSLQNSKMSDQFYYYY